MTEIDVNQLDDDKDDDVMNLEINNGSNRPKMSIDSILNGKVELKLPAIYLFHGSTDQSCPVSNSKTFGLALANYGVRTFIKIYENKSHTAPIIEDPISGKDPLVCDMLQIIYPDQSLKSIVKEIENTMTGGLTIPKIVIDLA